jgi:hypothetical protein
MERAATINFLHVNYWQKMLISADPSAAHYFSHLAACLRRFQINTCRHVFLFSALLLQFHCQWFLFCSTALAPALQSTFLPPPWKLRPMSQRLLLLTYLCFG